VDDNPTVQLVTVIGSVPSYESERMRSMTKRRQLVLDFIRAYVRLHGVPPSYEVIAKGIGLKSKSNIHRIVHRLKADGHLVTKPYKFHAIKLVDQSARSVMSL
jgi:SOS-response transcriptional repressor LexA